LNEVYIKADVSEDYIATVKAGTKVKVNFPSLNEIRYLTKHKQTINVRILLVITT
jgi:multidrug resistance efflux pump